MEIGIVGKPNVGKSTFFKAATMVDAEVANFPFTTIKPNVGVGYVRVACPCTGFKVSCTPNNSVCIKGNRFVPVKLIDVAGLVPGAHEGKGLGNQFLDDLRAADVLIHVVDISGRTNELGEPAEGYDPEADIAFLEREIDLWFYGILKKNWPKVQGKIKYSKRGLYTELAEQLSGLEVTENHVKDAAKKAGLSEQSDWTDDELMEFSKCLRESSKPIIIAANKIDMDDAGNFARLKDRYAMIPVCSEAELALRQADKAGLIRYLPGDPGFENAAEMDEKRSRALEYVRKNILERYGGTGLQRCLNQAVFETMGMIVVYPVENENRLEDSKGNVLPDAFLLDRDSTAEDMAYKVHTDIGERFIGAIDCRTKRKIGREHILQDSDVIKILTSR